MVGVVDQIEARDQVHLKDIHLSYAYWERDTLFITIALMEKDLLRSYEIIDDTIIAKKSLNLKSSRSAAKSLNDMPGTDAGVSYCTGCGNAIAVDENFCAKCGRQKKEIRE